MVNFDGVDFIECRSEEVISFFWRSAYVSYIWPINDIKKNNIRETMYA